MGCSNNNSAQTNNDQPPEPRQMDGGRGQHDRMRGDKRTNEQIGEEGQNEQIGNEGGEIEGDQMGGNRNPNNQMGENRGPNNQMRGRGGPGFGGQSGRGGKWGANNCGGLE